MAAPRAFDRTPPPPECSHSINALSAPMSDMTPGTVPRFVVSCASCASVWTGGAALAITLEATKAKLREIECLARNKWSPQAR